MNRREFIKRIGLTGGSMILGSSSGCQKSMQSTQGLPNILLIVVDDQGYADMGCTGFAEDVTTPNMDRLASK